MTRRARTTPGTNAGSFAPQARAEEDGVSLAPPGVPGDPGPGLVKPVTCRKCGGDGSFTYSSGAPGVCAPCGGRGQVEGDRGARAARKARQEAAASLYQAAGAHSMRAAYGFTHLRENEPERFEKALASHLAGRTDEVAAALDAYQLGLEMEKNPRLRAMQEIKTWEPPFDGLDTREGAFDKCKYVSASFAADMRARGYDVTWVQVKGMIPERPDAHPSMKDIDQEHWHHYVTRVTLPGPLDGNGVPTEDQVHYVDWTARQFSPEASYPLVTPTQHYERMWSEVYEIDDAANADAVQKYLSSTGHGRGARR